MDVNKALNNIHGRLSAANNLVETLAGNSRKNISNKNDDIIPLREIPKNIFGEFTDDYDIIYLNKIIISKLTYDYLALDEMEEKVKNLKQQRIETNNMSDYMSVCSELKNLEENMEKIKDKSMIKKYTDDTSFYIKKYRALPKNKRYIDIMKTSIDNYEQKTEHVERINIIIEYLEIASKYMNINIYHIKPSYNFSNNICAYCFESLVGIIPDINGNRICQDCGIENKSYKAETQIVREYDVLGNFEKAFMKFIGEEKLEFTLESMCEDLDNYFLREGKHTGEYFRNMKKNSKGKKDGSSMSMLFEALKQTGYNAYYENGNSIAHYYWEWDLPDAGYLKEIILSDYMETQAVWNTLDYSKKKRKSSIPRQFRLFKHLQLRGFKCDISDFKLTQKQTSIMEYDMVWKYMCDGCENPEIYYIKT